MKTSSTYSKAFQKCLEFHGHICPGLATGFQAARILMERLGVQKASDEELVAIVENDACGVDAIQVMTGCTFGKGNFVFKNYGKHAFTLIARNKKKAVRVCLRSGALEPDLEQLSLIEKVQRGEASPEENVRFNHLHEERAERVLNMDPEFLFKIEEISPDIPPKARISESEICDLCGEATKLDLLRDIHGKRVCIPCMEQRGFEGRDRGEEGG